MANNITINHLNHTVIATKSFLHAASIPYTNEFNLLTNLMRDLPDYQLEQKKIPARHKNIMPTYSAMFDYIQTHPNCDELMNEFAAVKARGAIRKNAYMLVRNWFLRTFPELGDGYCNEYEVNAA